MPKHTNPPQAIFTSFRQVAGDIALLILGSTLCATAINGILVPHEFVTGGITGISLILYKLFPFMNLSLIYLLLNVPLFILAWMAVGRRFFVFSLLGTILLTLALLVMSFNFNLEDRLLNALLAGLILGTGSGLCLKSSGSLGGIDILSIMLLKRFSIKIGNTVLAINLLVLLIVAVLYSLEAVLYTMIIVFVASKVIDIVVTGLSQRKSLIIISSEWEKIAQEILKDIKLGVTIIEGQGGFTHKKEHILYAVIPLTEIGQFKRIVQSIDPAAFVVISDTLEVMNYRIGNQPHW
jgi:uncharacterized membrane-anchored protein YitT (DUF2179 family)